MDKLMKRKERTGGAPACAGKRGIGRMSQRGAILSLFLLIRELMKCKISKRDSPYVVQRNSNDTNELTLE